MNERDDNLEEAVVRSVLDSGEVFDVSGMENAEVAALIKEKYAMAEEAFENNGVSGLKPKISLRLKKGDEEQTVEYAGWDDSVLMYIIQTAF